MEKYTCPNCSFDIENDEFQPDSIKCPNCNKIWETESDYDLDNYYCWIIEKEIINENRSKI